MRGKRGPRAGFGQALFWALQLLYWMCCVLALLSPGLWYLFSLLVLQKGTVVVAVKLDAKTGGSLACWALQRQ